MPFAAIAMLLAAAAAAPADQPPPAPPAPLAEPGALLASRIDMARLESLSPGWNLAAAEGNETVGSLTIERVVWPVFYLHWKSFEKAGLKLKSGEALGAKEAEAFIRQLWVQPSLDALGEATAIALPAHPGWHFEASTGKGIRTTRYIVWACPESGRLFAADMNIDLRTAAPLALLDWQEEMARTVRCHPDAPIQPMPRLHKTRELPDFGIAYSHPDTWQGIEGYRVQQSLDGDDYSATLPIPTREDGKDVVYVADSIRRLHLAWFPAAEGPMDYEILQRRVQDYWRLHALDIIEGSRKVSNDVWIMDGIVRVGPGYRKAWPPARRNKYRAWMWRKNGVAYFAVGDLAAVYQGRRGIGLKYEEWNLNLEDLFQAIRW